MLSLPPELRLQIIEALPVKDVYGSVALVCRDLYDDVRALSITRRFFLQVARYVFRLLEITYEAFRYEMRGPNLPGALDSFAEARGLESSHAVIKQDLERWYHSTFVAETSAFKSAVPGAALCHQTGLSGLVLQYRNGMQALTTLRSTFRSTLLCKHGVKAPDARSLLHWSSEEFRSYLQWKLTIEYWKQLPPIRLGEPRSLCPCQSRRMQSP